MKEKYTKAKEANRASGFHKQGDYGIPSRKRVEARAAMQPKPAQDKIYGYQTKYIQKIPIKDAFGQVTRFGRAILCKLVPHARMEAQG